MKIRTQAEDVSGVISETMDHALSAFVHRSEKIASQRALNQSEKRVQRIKSHVVGCSSSSCDVLLLFLALVLK